MAPKIKPKPQPPRRQADRTDENPAADEASSSVAAAQVPAPLRPAVTRLESIAGAPPVTGAAKAPLKYKPTGISRRTKEEREKAERDEQERLAARAVTAPLTAAAGKEGEGASGRPGGDPRGGMRGRGRGGILGGDRLRSTASGPFASASAAMGQKKYFTEGPRRGVTSSSSTSHAHAKLETEQGAASGQGGSARTPNIKAEIDELYKSSSDGEDANEGERVNIELINFVNGNDMYALASSKDEGQGGGPPGSGLGSLGLYPVRVDRKEHVDRVAGAGTEEGLGFAGARAEEGEEIDNGLFVPQDGEWEETGRGDKGKGKDLGFMKTERKWKGVYEDDDVEIKAEPTDTADPMAIDTLFVAEDAEMADVLEATVPSSSKPSSGTDKPSGDSKVPKGRKKSARKGYKPVTQTDEDRAEQERHKEDMRALVQELGNVGVAEPPTGDTTSGDGESAGAATNPAPPRDPKEGRLYLFQLPPVLPPLAPVIEPDPAGPSASPTPPNQKPTHPPLPPPHLLPEGFAGRMRVHRSGRATMEWGGHIFEIQKGGDWDFLTDVVATTDNGKERTACGMGPVKAKFVAVPDWTKLLP
ncbi:MAG: hypothetical protein M1839_000389 [Geoglossum umbratile]|nr:MAG: hypothetical protein M1839_000389 [Geoglossum umbratile]